ncbi:hypothetical protein AX16_006931 [Volvariella volvacea WC 439]|nr:hypothetical protein AX16_006931 [Volvariella volvacea WC 439]
MSLTRAAALARVRAVPVALASRRNASTASHGHEEHHHDDAQYPKEGFGGAVWRNTILAALVGVAFYKFAPEPGKDVYLTRWIAMYTRPSTEWLEINAKHAAQQQDVSDATILFADAKKPRIHRYRFPQVLDQASPFLVPVGGEVDVSNVVAKGDKDL